MDAVSTATGNGRLTTGSSCPKTEEKQKSANLRRPQKPQMGKKLTRNITIAQMVREILTPFTRAISLSTRTGPTQGEDRHQPGKKYSEPAKQTEDSYPEHVRCVCRSIRRHEDSGVETTGPRSERM